MNNPSPKRDKEVFVPVSLEQELPEKRGCYFVGWDKGTNQGFVSIDIGVWNPDKKVFEFPEEETAIRQPTHWLKEVSQTDKYKTGEWIRDYKAAQTDKDKRIKELEEEIENKVLWATGNGRIAVDIAFKLDEANETIKQLQSRIAELEEEVEQLKEELKIAQIDTGGPIHLQQEVDRLKAQLKEGQGTFTRRDMIDLLEYVKKKYAVVRAESGEKLWATQSLKDDNAYASEQILTQFINQKSK